MNRLIQLFSFLLMFPYLVLAEQSNAEEATDRAGFAVFVYGDVIVRSEQGNSRFIKNGDDLFSGDTLITTKNGQVQIRMTDGSFVHVRPNSEFMLSDYDYQSEPKTDKSEFDLVKGGFRAITGAIGKANSGAVKVKTPVASIGIRGTDFSIRLVTSDDFLSGDINTHTLANENRDDQPVRSGLYVGVLSGKIEVFNDRGALDLPSGSFGFVAARGAEPMKLKESAANLLFDKMDAPIEKQEDDDPSRTGPGESAQSQEPSDDRSQDEKTGVNSNQTDAETELASSIEPPITKHPNNEAMSKQPVFGFGSQLPITDSFESSLNSFGLNPVEDPTGDFVPDPQNLSRRLVGTSIHQLANERAVVGVALISVADMLTQRDAFIAGPTGSLLNVWAPIQSVDGMDRRGQYIKNSAQLIDWGFDASTGINWGRWAKGSMQIKTQETVLNQSLEQQSQHFILGPLEFVRPTLPTTGSAHYRLIGNTHPTDNRNNTGILGGASLNVNFDQQSVNFSTELGIAGEIWKGVNTGIPLQPNAKFDSGLQVEVRDAQGNQNIGTGKVSGALMTGPNAAELNGAATTFHMQAPIDDQSVGVSGTAIFERNQP